MSVTESARSATVCYMAEDMKMNVRRTTIDAHGREIAVEIEQPLDEYAQFRVSVLVDDKERWFAFFTDKSDD